LSRDVNEGAGGDIVLEVNIPEELVAGYEWVYEHEIGYRERVSRPAKIGMVTANPE
jgi:hypothetical protein